MDPLWIIVAALILLGALLYWEKRGALKGLLPTKTALSVLFVVAALVQTPPRPDYYHFVLTALAFCLVGDVCLAFTRKRLFLAGLVAFLVGHIFYIVAFAQVGRLNLLTGVGTLVIFLVSGTIFLWLRPYLESMQAPVLIYIIVISLMLAGAWAVLFSPELNTGGRILCFSGALAFYCSDIFVAKDRFLKQQFLNRLLGLPLYYTGQFFLAFSVGLLK